MQHACLHACIPQLWVLCTRPWHSTGTIPQCRRETASSHDTDDDCPIAAVVLHAVAAVAIMCQWPLLLSHAPD